VAAGAVGGEQFGAAFDGDRILAGPGHGSGRAASRRCGSDGGLLGEKQGSEKE
jgi:hypothetical protein